MQELLFVVLYALVHFLYLYPLIMGYFWIFGTLLYYKYRERDEVCLCTMDEYAMVSVIVPVFNEEKRVEEVVSWLHKLRYPNYEIIVVNDGSRDKTAKILRTLLLKSDRLRVVELRRNQGKATALNMGAMVSRGEFLLCIDGDTLLDRDAVCWMVRHFVNNPRVAAVTGNPIVRNRSTLLGRVQVGEFSTIIGMIKRTQSIYGRLFALSGTISAFRKAALHDVGYWSTDMLTEDIDICWRLQIRHWQVLYEPKALCWVLMPESLGGLWRQRVRWAQGGVEVVLKYSHIFSYWKQRRMWPLYGEYLLSLFWAFGLFLLPLFWLLLDASFEKYYLEEVMGVLGFFLGVTFLLQVMVGFFVSSGYEKGIGRYGYGFVWYPLFYWMVIALSAVVGFFKALVGKRRKHAVWRSPDRGVV